MVAEAEKGRSYGNLHPTTTCQPLLAKLVLPFTFTFICLLFASAVINSSASSTPFLFHLRIGTFNIRYDGRSSSPVPIPPFPSATHLEDDPETTGAGESDWSKRRWKVADSVLWDELDIVGFQEALTNQCEDLQVLLGDKYSWVGVGRDDGKKAGEYVPLFYRHDKFSLTSVHHFWLSTTPEIPGSVSWDAGQTRMVSLTSFRRRRQLSPQTSIITQLLSLWPLSLVSSRAEEREEIVVANTHWDDRGVLSRTESAGVILDQIDKLVKAGKIKTDQLVILVGDLNSPDWEDGYRRLTGDRYNNDSSGYNEPEAKEQRTTFLDSRHSLQLAQPRSVSLRGTPLMHSRYGELSTFTGFTVPPQTGIIDVILHLDNGVVAGAKEGNPSWKVVRFGVVPNEFEDGVGGIRSSDHRLVVAAFEKLG